MIRRFLQFLILGLLALAIVVAVMFVVGLYWNRDRESTFYLVDAEFVDIGYLDKLQSDLQASDPFREDLGFGFSAHRLTSGQGTVLAYRHFSEGDVLAVDDETYRKLTVWLPPSVSMAAKQSLRIPEQGIVLMSSGGSAWPSGDCSGYINGVVELTPVGAEIDVRIQGRFEPRGNRNVGHVCKPREFALQFQAGPARLQDLRPWQGGAGASNPYDETYTY